MPDEYAPPPGPPPGYQHQQSVPRHWQSNNPFRSQLQAQDSTPLSGSPPNHAAAQDDFEPPPGPPPQQVDPPPYEHPWDTSTLPPPPTLGNLISPTSNATKDSADLAEEWCIQNPLTPPQYLSESQRDQVRNGDLSVVFPPGFKGTVGSSGQTMARAGTSKHGKEKSKGSGLLGKIKGKLDKDRPEPSTPSPISNAVNITTRDDCADTVVLSSLPLFSAQFDSPLYTGRPKTSYYELRVLRLGTLSSALRQEAEAESSVAIGFLAPPYPPWRLPGWERGSLAIHGDDGRRYVNDGHGGIDFTTAFRVGEVVGIGMTLWAAGNRCEGEVFFTREGRREGSWSLQEQMDERQVGGVEGLVGDRDLYAAVGFFGAVESEIRFKRQEWLFRPEQ